MAWITPTIDDAFRRRLLTPQEWLTLTAIQTGNDQVPVEVAGAIDEIRGAISGGNYPLGAAGTIPAGMVNDLIAIARWHLLAAFPQLQKLQTDARKQAFDASQQKLRDITQQDYSPEPPTAGVNPSTGSWNSENKLIMRTHPVPPPSSQNQQGDPTQSPYANPDGPTDT